MTIQNKKKPNQVIEVYLDPSNSHFETEGLQKYFGQKEIRVEPDDILASLPEYGEVLSFLLETMSAAQDLRLPYFCQNTFDFKGTRYALREEGDLRVLKRA